MWAVTRNKVPAIAFHPCGTTEADRMVGHFRDPTSEPMRIIGIDLAWGEHKGDGVCLIDVDAATDRAEVTGALHLHGDAALLAWLDECAPPPHTPALLLFDAPLICPNATGSRPVDRLTHTLFGRFHAGAHPANATRCPRPLRLVEALARRGYRVDWRLAAGPRLAVEVFPHPAMIRLLGLARIVKYKRGPVAARRAEFARLQGLLRACLRDGFAELTMTPAQEEILRAPWTKPDEDRLDAFVCALVGFHHWRHAGARSEIIGDLETGFILLPSA